MDAGHLLLLLLFLLTIGHLVTLKVCSLKLDHKTAPLFISGWTLLGLALLAPVYGHLWAEGWQKFMDRPWLLVLAGLKGGLLCYLFIVSQQLMKVSLSSRHYVTPLSLGLITIGNGLFGEALKPAQLFASLGLCALALGFFLKGHLSDLDRKDRWRYAELVGISAGISILDHILTADTNWYALLVVAYTVVFITAVIWNRHSLENFRIAAGHKAAALAGILYAATELVKFYQQVSINPVTVVVTVQAMTKPVILVLSAWLWHERTVREQLVWGGLAFLITLPLLLPDDILSAIWQFLEQVL